MNETSTSPFPTSAEAGMQQGMGADSGRVRKVAQAAHEAVDKLEQTLGTSTEKVMGLQQEYGDMAREQVRSNPLAAVGVAFAVGIVFSKLFLR